MYYEASTNEVDKTYNIRLQLTKRDLEELNLDIFSQAKVRHCMETNLISDKLTALAIIFKNIEDQVK